MWSKKPYQMAIPQYLVARMVGTPQLLALLVLYSINCHQVICACYSNKNQLTCQISKYWKAEENLHTPAPLMLPWWLRVKEFTCNVGDLGSIPELGRSPEEGIGYPLLCSGLPLWLNWQRILLQCGRPGFDPWVGKTPWRRQWLRTPVFRPGEFHGQRGLAGYSPWDH